MATDPVSNLIETLKTPPGDSSPLAQGEAPGPTDHLSQAADLIPDRRPTEVPDVKDSDLLRRFQQQRRSGLIEIAIVDGLFDLVRDLLIWRGIAL